MAWFSVAPWAPDERPDMCGVLFSNDPAVGREAFMAALGMMEHRGPDAPACYAAHRGTQLGHNRLQIVDLDPRSNQPFYSRDGRYAIVYNGEIYNYRELIQTHGLTPRTGGDTEVLLELYAAHGAKMLPWLNGMFAFVILDLHSGEWFAARDRLGVKPLYYVQSGDTITFASEIAPLVWLYDKTAFDPVGLRQYRKLRAFFNGRTLYRGISMLPAGHTLQGRTLRPWWRLPDGPQSPPADDELRGLVESAVASRLVADVAVGSYLSGGLDSTIVAALSGRPDTWTVGFADDNEFPWGRLAADRLGSRHTEVVIDRDEFVALAAAMVRMRREPLSVPNEVLLYRMTSEVKRRNTVVLSGEGADELFFGYDRIFRWAAAGHWDLGTFARLYSYGSHDDLEVVEDALAPFQHYGTPLDMVAAFFQVAHLHGLLRRLDSSTMLCGVEAREPFVDHRLVERMAGVPFAYRMAGGVVKAPLKRVFADLVPAPIIERAKVGFPVPLDSMPLPGRAGLTPMDRWLEFNLQQLAGAPLGLEEVLR
jgi:asparagine synthase (glutamine-hydrolysing)